MKRGDIVGSIRTLEHTHARMHEECRGCPKEFADPPECKGLAHALQRCTEKPVDTAPVLEEHYGAKVWTDREMDGLRRARCLCLRCERCGRIKRPTECRSARDLLELCHSTDIALMVTRCPRFVGKGG